MLATMMTKAVIPAFLLGPLIQFDPKAFDPNNDLDRLILMFSLVFNDLKDLEMIRGWCFNDPSANAEVSPRRGQIVGMHEHMLRLEIAVIHEFLHAIEKRSNVIESPEFQSLLATTPKATRDAWGALRALSNRNKDRSFEESKLYNMFNEIRNKTAFHYYDMKPLSEAYRQRFLERHFTAEQRAIYERDGQIPPEQKQPYFSGGDTMENSRFYYADAAAETHMKVAAENRDIDLGPHFSRTANALNVALAPLIVNFISNKTGGTTPHFKAVDIQRGSAMSRPRPNRAKTKAARKARRKNR
jgi:hypothetical protein